MKKLIRKENILFKNNIFFRLIHYLYAQVLQYLILYK